MHLTTGLLALVVALATPTIAEDGIEDTFDPATVTGGAVHPEITAPPKNGFAVQVKAQVAGPLTISVVNKYGSGLYGAYRHAVGGKAAISVPKAGPIGSSFKCIYPPEWEGNIAIGKSLNPEIYKGTLIEASYKGGKPFINVSNVQGWTVPLTCSCGSANGHVLSGCNLDLNHNNPACPIKAPHDMCLNPKSNSPQPTRAPADPFFQKCAGAAYTYPNDWGSGENCINNLVVCCIGTNCPKPSKQHA